jgi:hypothetical protein
MKIALAAIAASLTLTSGAIAADPYYMVVNSGSKYIMLFDKSNGQAVNDQWIDLFNATPTPGTIKDAIQVLNEIWVSDQTQNVIYRFKADKTTPTYLGTITDAGLNNLRGMAFDGATVYVSCGANSGSGFAAGVVRMTRTGNVIDKFSTNLTSPFDVFVAGNELLVSDFSNHDIGRYQPDGTYIADLVPIAATAGLRGPQQVTLNNAGNLLVGGFTPTAVGIYVFNPSTGAELNYYPVGGVRGTAQLDDGRYVWCDGLGLNAYNATTGSSTRLYGGSSSSSGQYINLVDFDATGCPADFNGDGFLDFTDFDDFVSAFEAGAASADFNSDGFLDFTDFDDFVSAFEAGC